MAPLNTVELCFIRMFSSLATVYFSITSLHPSCLVPTSQRSIRHTVAYHLSKYRTIKYYLIILYSWLFSFFLKSFWRSFQHSKAFLIWPHLAATCFFFLWWKLEWVTSSIPLPSLQTTCFSSSFFGVVPHKNRSRPMFCNATEQTVQHSTLFEHQSFLQWSPGLISSFELLYPPIWTP